MKAFLSVILGILAGVVLTLAAVFTYGALAGRTAEKAAPLPDGPAAVITHVVGPVFVIRGTETLPATPGDRLEPGDIVKVTDGAVAQVQLADKGSALLGSDTLVRFLKLTGADRKLELRTEILTGSLSYKVEKLDESESIIIEADGNEYEVRGTEFLIEKKPDGTTLSVGSGTVRVSGNVENGMAEVDAGKQLRTVKDAPAARVENLDEENRQRLDASAPLPAMPFGFDNAPVPVLLEIITHPGDSDIYIDGLKTGTGRFKGLLPKGTTLNIRIRRRGFIDSVFNINVDKNKRMEVNLSPANLEETLSEAEKENPLLNRLRRDYERRLEDLTRSFSEREREGAGLENEREQLINNLRESVNQREQELARARAETEAKVAMERAERAVAETALEDSRAENERLRDLIVQIQELAAEE